VLSGPVGAPGENLVFTVVLGPLQVVDRMQGETDFGPSSIACYQYSMGYYGYLISDRKQYPGDGQQPAAPRGAVGGVVADLGKYGLCR
jgi:hypothetical protein